MAATQGDAGTFLLVGYVRRSYDGATDTTVEYLCRGWRHALHVARRIRAHRLPGRRAPVAVRAATIRDLARPQRQWGGEGW